MNPEPVHSIPTNGNRTKIGLLVAAVILLFALGYGAYHAVKNASGSTREAVAIGDKFLALQQKHDFAGAHNLLFPQAQAMTSTQKLAKLQSMVEQAQGKDIQYGTPSWQYNVNNGISSVHLIYPLKSTSSSGSVSIVVVETPSGWKVYNYNFSF